VTNGVNEAISLVQSGWQQPMAGCKMHQVVQKLKAVKQKLKAHHRTRFGNVHIT